MSAATFTQTPRACASTPEETKSRLNCGSSACVPSPPPPHSHPCPRRRYSGSSCAPAPFPPNAAPIQAQIELALASGLDPTHLDTHMQALLLRPAASVAMPT